MSEVVYRWAFALIFGATLFVSGYFRHRARRTGDIIPRAREGGSVVLVRLFFALDLYLPMLADVANPLSMA